MALETQFLRSGAGVSEARAPGVPARLPNHVYHRRLRVVLRAVPCWSPPLSALQGYLAHKKKPRRGVFLMSEVPLYLTSGCRVAGRGVVGLLARPSLCPPLLQGVDRTGVPRS